MPWSSGMIFRSGRRGSGFDSPRLPVFCLQKVKKRSKRNETVSFFVSFCFSYVSPSTAIIFLELERGGTHAD